MTHIIFDYTGTAGFNRHQARLYIGNNTNTGEKITKEIPTKFDVLCNVSKLSLSTNNSVSVLTKKGIEIVNLDKPPLTSVSINFINCLHDLGFNHNETIYIYNFPCVENINATSATKEHTDIYPLGTNWHSEKRITNCEQQFIQILVSPTGKVQTRITQANDWKEKGISPINDSTYKGMRICFKDSTYPSLTSAITSGELSFVLKNGQKFISYACTEPDPHLPHLNIHMKEVF